MRESELVEALEAALRLARDGVLPSPGTIAWFERLVAASRQRTKETKRAIAARPVLMQARYGSPALALKHLERLLAQSEAYDYVLVWCDLDGSPLAYSLRHLAATWRLRRYLRG